MKQLGGLIPNRMAGTEDNSAIYGMAKIGEMIASGITKGFANQNALMDPHQQSIFNEQKEELIQEKYKKLQKKRADTITLDFIKKSYTVGGVIEDILNHKSKHRGKGNNKKLFQTDRFASATMVIIADNYSKNKLVKRKVDAAIKELEEIHPDDRVSSIKSPERMGEILNILLKELLCLREQIVDPLARLAVRFLCNAQETGSTTTIILESLNKKENNKKGCQEVMKDLGLYEFKVAELVKDRQREEASAKKREEYNNNKGNKEDGNTNNKRGAKRKWKEACTYAERCKSLTNEAFTCTFFHTKGQKKEAKRRKINKPAEENKEAE